MSEGEVLQVGGSGVELPATARGRGLSEVQLDAFIAERTGGCRALGEAWPKSEWESARRVQQGLRPSKKVPGTFLAKCGIPPWLRAAIRGVPLLEASHCAFPAWFAVASPAADWFALADAQPDLRVTSDESNGAPSTEVLRETVRLASGYTVQLTMHVVVAPVSGAAEVEAIVVGVALSGARKDASLLSLAVSQRVGFAPSQRLTFTPARATEPTSLSWEWGGPFLNVALGASERGGR